MHPLLPASLARLAGTHGAILAMAVLGVEERRYMLEAKAGAATAKAAITARRRGRRVAVTVEQVEPPRMEPAVRMLAELIARSRSPWLYRGPRWAGKRTRGQLHVGPTRLMLEAVYGSDGWLLDARIHGHGVEARIKAWGSEDRDPG